jgi:hypothetical protein
MLHHCTRQEPVQQQDAGMPPRHAPTVCQNGLQFACQLLPMSLCIVYFFWANHAIARRSAAPL